MTAAVLSLKSMTAASPVVLGKFGDAAAGYPVGTVAFTFALREERVGRTHPVLHGIYDGDRLVGIYSPFDILFSQTGCKAFGSRGYAADDARALATNIVLLACTRKQKADGK